jgi:5'(3')-deoxyribonucleotidase
VKISDLKDKFRSNNVKGLALDIDETLSDTHDYWFEHMFKFHSPKGIAREDILKSHHFIENVPEWQTAEAVAYIEEALHSNDFNESIPLIEGADKAVSEIHKTIPIVAYITARPDSVREGTFKWLNKHGFPVAELITRSENIDLNNYNVGKNAWKAKLLKSLYPEVIGIVDDNVVLAHELEKLNYEGVLYIYGKGSREFADRKNIIPCQTWTDVLRHIVK